MNETFLAKRYVLFSLLCIAFYTQRCHTGTEKQDDLSPRSKIKQLKQTSRSLDTIIIKVGLIGQKLREEGFSEKLDTEKKALLEELHNKCSNYHISLTEKIKSPKPVKQQSDSETSRKFCLAPGERKTRKGPKTVYLSFDLLTASVEAIKNRAPVNRAYCSVVTCWSTTPCPEHTRL